MINWLRVQFLYSIHWYNQKGEEICDEDCNNQSETRDSQFQMVENCKKAPELL